MQKSRCLFSFITEAIFFIVARRRYESQFCPCFFLPAMAILIGGTCIACKEIVCFCPAFHDIMQIIHELYPDSYTHGSSFASLAMKIRIPGR